MGKLTLQRQGKYEEAKHWFQTAFENGFYPALYQLAKIEMKSPAGLDSAMEMFRVASSMGHLKSKLEYAKLLISGRKGGLGRIVGVGKYAAAIVLILWLVSRGVEDERFMY